jgi:two-component sensor histidine kinase
VVTTDRAVTVALLINELITNVTKYAYPAGGCECWVALSRDDAGVTISVRDEGVGLPSDFDAMNSGGLGMRLITGFARQLRGSLDVLCRKPGTEFLITFPVDQM